MSFSFRETSSGPEHRAAASGRLKLLLTSKMFGQGRQAEGIHESWQLLALNSSLTRTIQQASDRSLCSQGTSKSKTRVRLPRCTCGKYALTMPQTCCLRLQRTSGARHLAGLLLRRKQGWLLGSHPIGHDLSFAEWDMRALQAYPLLPLPLLSLTGILLRYEHRMDSRARGSQGQPGTCSRAHSSAIRDFLSSGTHFGSGIFEVHVITLNTTRLHLLRKLAHVNFLH